MQKTSLLTSETAAQFPDEISDGFARPQLAWSAFGPQHLEDMGGDCMTSNVWIGEPVQLRAFIEALAVHYDGMKANVQDELDPQYQGVSLGYWEKDGLAMVGEFCTGDSFFDQMSDVLLQQSRSMNLILCDGNDNDPGHILKNSVANDKLDVATRLTLAHFMTSSALWVINNEYDERELDGYTDADKAALRAILERNLA